MGRKAHADRTALTAAFVKQKDLAAGKYYDKFGLYLRVKPTGAKTWAQKITINGKQRELGLGSALLVPLSDARALAFDYLRAAKEGRDPIAERKRISGIPTFSDAVERVHELHRANWSSAKHAAQFRSTLSTYACKYFGDKKICDVTSGDIYNALEPIWVKKPETARRVRQRIGRVMKWAISQNYITNDPSNAIEEAFPKVAKAVQHRKALPYDQVSACIDAVRKSKASDATKLAVEFLILTGLRSKEVRFTVWSEIDIANKLFIIPVDRMKTKSEHVVPLSSRAVEILAQARHLGGQELVFPSPKTGRAISDMTMSKLIKELGFDADIHGFRTSFRVWTQERTNVSFEVAEKSLAHKVGNKVTAAYARSNLLEKRRGLMQRWSDFLQNEDASIIPITGRSR